MGKDDSLNTAVVVADARAPVMKEVSSTLEKAGFRVVTASNGRAALDRVREQNRVVDLAIIDTAASGINSLEVAEQLHEMSPRVRMLFLSDNPETPQETAPSGHVGCFLRKPFRRSRFLGRVLEIMEQPKTFTA
jgi:two-component system cell cycle sensor histidine kinase/response regulator CckA